MPTPTGRRLERITAMGNSSNRAGTGHLPLAFALLSFWGCKAPVSEPPVPELPLGEIDPDWVLAEHAVVLRHLGDQGPFPDYAAPRLGAGVAVVDANLDGRLDVAVGAPFWSPGDTDFRAPNAVFFLDGAALGLSGGTGVDVQQSSFATVLGDPVEFGFGESICGVGDLNQSGTPEVEINGWAMELPILGVQASRENRAWFLGTGEDEWNYYYNSVYCGDLNEDGFDDYCNAPAVWFGPLVNGMDYDDAALMGVGEFIRAGPLRLEGPYSVVGGVDNHDEQRGVVLVFHPDRQGGFEDPVFIVGAEPGDKVGNWNAVGELTGDGRGDLLIGSVLARDRAGRAWIWPDADVGGSLADATIVFEARNEGDQLGWVSAIGDFDGDGQQDVAFGIPGNPYAPAVRPGRVSVFRGPFAPGTYTEDDAARVWYGSPYAGDSFGAKLAAGDIDGDGADELIVGAPEDAQLELHGGAVYVLYDVL